MASPTPQVTDFSRDVLGRYMCNDLGEALRSTDRQARPEARPLDIIVIGGGSFASVFAVHAFFQDKTRCHRILVLEGGPFVLSEHVQNLPMLGLNVPGPTSIAELRAAGLDRTPRNEVWGLAWHSGTKFPGLAYCVGGRSVFWGGWSPRLLDAEMPPDRWPASVRQDLARHYFADAAEQIGVDETNDFIRGPLHDALRQALRDGIAGGKVASAVPLAEIPTHLKAAAGAPPAEQDLLKLEAPLAVQSAAPSGYFPMNKFSAVPLLMEAVRASVAEAGGNDVQRRLMVVPNCHVTRLDVSGGAVRAVETSQGQVPVPPSGIVVVGCGTIESTRLALDAFGGSGAGALIGQNLMAHLRSNLTIRFPRTAVAIDPAIRHLEASALFVKGRFKRADGRVAHFHLQITAAGLGALGTDSELELFKKLPDIDLFHTFRDASSTHVVVTIRGIGEMEPRTSNNTVRLDPERDEYGIPRAFVAIAPSDADRKLWDAMDAAANDVAAVLASGPNYEVLSRNRDGLGSTHHETGTLWMGEDPAQSVTDANGRFHGVANAYAVGPALLPTIGSPNPMLTGVALARRLADHVVPAGAPVASAPAAAERILFDGGTLTNWRMAGRGSFIVSGGTLIGLPGDDLGLLWCSIPTPPDFVLKLEWLGCGHADNSGVFVRFPDPTQKGYANEAYVGVDFGFEIQIDELGAPDGLPKHTTGAVYNQDRQTFALRPAKPAGSWNEFEIRVRGQRYLVFLNGAQVTDFTNLIAGRGLASTAAAPSFVGLQTHPGPTPTGLSRVAFRNIRIAAL
jgi:choline dehydrogenase-like flavoprotein